MKKLKIFLVLLSLCLSACWGGKNLKKLNYSERQAYILSIDGKLSKEYDKLLEDPIQESKRKNLEVKFQAFYNTLMSLDSTEANHRDFLKQYQKKTKTKLQYLKDLQGL